MFDRLNNAPYWLMIAWGVIGWIKIITNQLPLLFLHESVGAGDSYILGSVESFRRTGVLYPALTAEHPVPTLYSPALYLMHALAWTALPATNPYIGPRLLELVWFLICILATALLSRTLVARRKAFPLALLLAGSFATMSPWLLQLRGDFPGIACSLFAIYFLLSGGWRRAVLAGICAGLATQFKITFAAAAVAGALWLLLYRSWSRLAGFVVATGICSIGIYLLFMWRESEMAANIFMMSHVIPHLRGVVFFIRETLAEPVFLLGIATLLTMLIPLLVRPHPRWQLVAIFTAVSVAMAAVTSLQAGANINYFYEAMFAATPFAVFGMMRLRAMRSPLVSMFLGLLLLMFLIRPQVFEAVYVARRVGGEVAQRNQQYDRLRAALAGIEFLSTIPDVTILGKERIITDSGLLNYRVLTAGADLSALEQRVSNQEFAIIATLPDDISWRGLPALPRGLRKAIVEAYRPYCVLGDELFHIPAGKTGNVGERLTNIGCVVTACRGDAKCSGLGIQVERFVPTP